MDKLQNPILDFDFSVVPGTEHLRSCFPRAQTLHRFHWSVVVGTIHVGSERSRFGQKEKMSYNRVTAITNQ